MTTMRERWHAGVVGDREYIGWLEKRLASASFMAGAVLGDWQAQKLAQQEREDEAEFLAGPEEPPEPEPSRPYVSADDEARTTIKANWPDEPKRTAASGTVGLEDSTPLNASVNYVIPPPDSAVSLEGKGRWRFVALRSLWRGLKP